MIQTMHNALKIKKYLIYIFICMSIKQLQTWLSINCIELYDYSHLFTHAYLLYTSYYCKIIFIKIKILKLFLKTINKIQNNKNNKNKNIFTS